ncbi:MAG: sialidase family protein [Polyangiales bacterium]
MLRGLHRTTPTTLVALTALTAGCPSRPSQPDAPPAVSPAQPAPQRPATRPPPPRAQRDDEDRGCAPPPPPVVAPGWVLRGYHPGPALEDVVAVGPRRGTLLATTRTAVCASRDGGETWTTSLEGVGRLPAPRIERLESTGAVLVIAQGDEGRAAAPRVWVSRDDGEHWEGLALPTDGDAGSVEGARVFTDGSRRVFVTTPQRMWTSVNLDAFDGPVTLPGSRAEGVDVCGDVLVGKAQVDADGVWHHSEDWGRSWRPLRLGRIGLEGGSGMLRCLHWRGGIEAGRPPLPGWWSFDQGRTWQPARYDHHATRLARAMSEDPTLGGEAPRCMTAPTGALACVQAGRLVMPDPDGEWSVARPAQRGVRAPGGAST